MLPLILTSLSETSAWVRLRALYVAPLLISLFIFAACDGGAGN